MAKKIFSIAVVALTIVSLAASLQALAQEEVPPRVILADNGMPLYRVGENETVYMHGVEFSNPSVTGGAPGIPATWNRGQQFVNFNVHVLGDGGTGLMGADMDTANNGWNTEAGWNGHAQVTARFQNGELYVRADRTIPMSRRTYMRDGHRRGD